jgi:ribonuclease HII
VDPSSRSLSDLKAYLNEIGGGREREGLLKALENDPRKGARDLARMARNRDDNARRREARWRAFCDPELQVLEKGFRRIAGVDEAGRGPLAGPVVAAAVILPGDFVHHPLDDSKRMTARSREEAYLAITAGAVAWSEARASAEEVDRHNVLGAVHLAVERALAELEPPAEFALVDGRPLSACPVPHRAIVKGDRRCRAIAAASVIAKVTRDHLMAEMDDRYPGYGFAEHKGYGTPDHLHSLDRLGPSPIHRRSFGRQSGQLELLAATGQESSQKSSRESTQESSRESTQESSQEWGRRAEELVAADYESQGYQVLHRRWRGGGGEIDLVCRRGREIVVVEIKAARGPMAGSPMEWLGRQQRRRWRRAASELMRELRKDPDGAELRFDLVGVLAQQGEDPALTRFEGIQP